MGKDEPELQALKDKAEELIAVYNKKRAAKDKSDDTRLLWRTEGIKKKGDSGTSAPPWVDFNPNKAKFNPALKKQIEGEMAEWRKSTTLSSVAIDKPKDEDAGPRFSKSDFKTDEEAAVKSQVSRNAFAQADPRKGKGKGKDRERRGRDDWEGEEKRAPQAGFNIFSFVKPTKDGALPDEAVSAMLKEPEKPKAQSYAQDSWGESANSWSGGGGGGGGWSAGGGGGGGWESSGGGWSSGGWGGGGGKGKGGGKGGSKGGGGGGGKGKGGGGKGKSRPSW